MPGVAPLELLLARSDKVAVCATYVAAYASGFVLELRATAGSDEDDLDPWGDYGGRPREPREAGMLKVGVQFADGSKATNLARPHFSHDEPPPGPVLRTLGGGGGGGGWLLPQWVWPLPPPGPLALVCEWPAAGIPLTRHEIEAQVILDAAQRAHHILAEEGL